jgi:hypothetical protein
MIPDFVTREDLNRWNKNIDEDPYLDPKLAEDATIREICLAGHWLLEELDKLGCSDSIEVTLQYLGGKLSFGRDPWIAHEFILNSFKNNLIVFENIIYN